MTGKKKSKGKINGKGPLIANNATLSKTFETLVRLGYAARRIIYFVI